MRLFPTEYQRRHASLMQMERMREGYTGHPRGRIAHALLTAAHYRGMALAPSNDAGARKFWLGLAWAALGRARDDRTITQPAEARMLRAADACVERTDALIHLMSDRASEEALERLT